MDSILSSEGELPICPVGTDTPEGCVKGQCRGMQPTKGAGRVRGSFLARDTHFCMSSLEALPLAWPGPCGSLFEKYDSATPLLRSPQSSRPALIFPQSILRCHQHSRTGRTLSQIAEGTVGPTTQESMKVARAGQSRTFSRGHLGLAALCVRCTQIFLWPSRVSGRVRKPCSDQNTLRDGVVGVDLGVWICRSNSLLFLPSAGTCL